MWLRQALPLVIDRLADPVTAVLLSIVVVLVFGEIIPQVHINAHLLQYIISLLRTKARLLLQSTSQASAHAEQNHCITCQHES